MCLILKNTVNCFEFEYLKTNHIRQTKIKPFLYQSNHLQNLQEQAFGRFNK